MFGCHCQLVTADWRRYLMCSFVFPHFINYIVTWSSGRVHFISFWRNFLVHSNINPRKSEFEFVAFKLLDFERIQSSDSQDPDKNFFNAFNFKDSQYFTSKDFSRNLNYFDKSSASTLHLNIRSLQKKKKKSSKSGQEQKTYTTTYFCVTFGRYYKIFISGRKIGH